MLYFFCINKKNNYSSFKLDKFPSWDGIEPFKLLNGNALLIIKI